MRTKRNGRFRPGVRTALLIWLSSIGVGFWALTNYSITPGEAAESPTDWPIASGLVRQAGLPTLVMAVHAECPCSRASLHELAWIMSRSEGRVTAHILFVQPEGIEFSPWHEGLLLNDAKTIPGVRVLKDEKGTESRFFGAKTSGEVLLYNAEGKLIFSGGITGSRGHEGANAGREAILARLGGHPESVDSTPVFGCSIFGEHAVSFSSEGQACTQ